MIPRENNDKLCELARYWKLDGDWMTCKACKRSLIASRDGEPIEHASGCKNADRLHPWVELRALIGSQASTPASDEQMRQDAARYQWLRRCRGQEHDPLFTVQHELDGLLWGGDLDAAIDAAMAGGSERG